MVCASPTVHVHIHAQQARSTRIGVVCRRLGFRILRLISRFRTGAAKREVGSKLWLRRESAAIVSDRGRSRGPIAAPPCELSSARPYQQGILFALWRRQAILRQSAEFSGISGLFGGILRF